MTESEVQIDADRPRRRVKRHTLDSRVVRGLTLLPSALLLFQCTKNPLNGDMNGTVVDAGRGTTSIGAAGVLAAPAGTPTSSLPMSGSAGGSGNPAVSTAMRPFRAGSGAGAPSMAASGTGAAGRTAAPVAGMGFAGTSAATAGGGAPTMGGPAMPSSGCGKTGTPPSGNQTIDVDGVQRAYIVKVPSNYEANTPYRLVFAWHGLGGTAMQIASNYYGLVTRSANSALFIAGQGQPGTGQQNGLATWTIANDSDVVFTRKMLEWAKANYCIDVRRVFSIGMSAGGMMSNIVGCELGDSFRAMVAMSGGGPKGYATKPCTGQLAVWISHGNKDDNVPFSYGKASRDYWAKANHCGTETVPVMPGTCLEYQGCDAGFPVQFCEFDGGHMVPSFAGEAAWNFFLRF